MNSTAVIASLARVGHPEQSLAASAVNRLTESKDPAPADRGASAARSFRIVVRFFDEREFELRPVSSRETADCDSPMGQCRGCASERTSPAWTVRSDERITQ
jgi:hypothetical protein